MSEEALALHAAAERTPTRASALPPGPARPWGVLALAGLVTVQVALVAFLMWLFANPAFQTHMDLEARPLVAVESMAPPPPLDDTLNVFSGPADLANDVERRDYRRQLVPDRGDFAWIVLDDAASPHDLLYRLGSRGSDRAAWRQAVSDGVLNFFYDMGGRADYFTQNWSAVGAPELKASALLSWTKSVDFCALSTYLPDHCQGLRFLRRKNPRLPVLVPAPLPDEASLVHEALAGLQRVLVLPAGFHPLSPRLAAYVYTTDPLPDARYQAEIRQPPAGMPARRHAALALLLRGHAGLTLTNGVDGLPPDELIRRVETASGERVTRYVGATGYRFGLADPNLVRRLRRLRRSHPELIMVPSYATSPAAHGLIRTIFGARHYQAGTLGARIAL